MSSARATVLIGDDHVMVAEGLRDLLEPRYDVVGIEPDGRAVVEAARKLQPDVVLVDITMAVMNGIDATRLLLVEAPKAKVVIVTMHTEPPYVAEAFHAGAHGYLIKVGAASELETAIEAVLAGERYVSTNARLPVDSAPGDLTPRQRDVVRLLAEGRAMKEIADLLQISIKTVEFHKSKTIQRLGVSNTAGLIRYAVAHGMVIEPA